MAEKILDSYIRIALLGSGYAAVHMVRIDDTELGIYEDVQQTGIGRYKERKQAVSEAIMWAAAEEIPLKL